MTIKIALLFGITCLTSFCSFGQLKIQCDSIKILNEDFDRFFQDEYYSIKVDTVLAIRHCSNTQNCSFAYGLLCWKEKGQFYFKKVLLKKDKTKATLKLDKKLKRHLISFYERQIFQKTGEIEEIGEYYFDGDWSYTTLLFKTKDNCWRFRFRGSNFNDIRVAWTSNLLSLMMKITSREHL